MNGEQFLNGLELDDDDALDDQVDSVADVEAAIPIDQGQSNLALMLQTSNFELAAQALFVRRLEQTRSGAAMDLDGRADDRMG